MTNKTLPMLDSEMIKYGPYMLIPLSGERVALPGRQVVSLKMLQGMALKNKFGLKIPTGIRW